MSEIQTAGEAPPAASLHQRILSDIEDRILSGDWPPGHRIPSEHDLTARYACSRMTVNKALTRLAQIGLIERRRKAGSFVRRPQSQSAVLEIQDIRAEVASLGRPYRHEILARLRRRSTAPDRRQLGLDGVSPVLDLACRHFAGVQPFCVERRLINLAAAPEAAGQDFAEIAPGPWLIGRIPWTAAEHRIGATGADADTAARLQVAAGTACLVVERRTWSAERPVTFVRLVYPGEMHELVARFAPPAG